MFLPCYQKGHLTSLVSGISILVFFVILNWKERKNTDKGIAKIAKKLGFDYAEAVTSFEFKKGRAFPVITGIVIASENEETLLEVSFQN